MALEVGTADAVKWTARKGVHDHMESVKSTNNLDELVTEVLSDPARIEILERKGPQTLAEMRKWAKDRSLQIP